MSPKKIGSYNIIQTTARCTMRTALFTEEGVKFGLTATLIIVDWALFLAFGEELDSGV